MHCKAGLCNLLGISHDSSQKLHLMERTAFVFVFMVGWYCLSSFNVCVESWDIWCHQNMFLMFIFAFSIFLYFTVTTEDGVYFLVARFGYV